MHLCMTNETLADTVMRIASLTMKAQDTPGKDLLAIAVAPRKDRAPAMVFAMVDKDKTPSEQVDKAIASLHGFKAELAEGKVETETTPERN